MREELGCGWFQDGVCRKEEAEEYALGIVRCRDCTYYRKSEHMGFTDEQCARTCWYDNSDRMTDVCGDGFCAWGEVKNG